MLPAILGLGGLTAKIIATAVIPRVVRAISQSFSATRPAELCPSPAVEGISSGPEPAPAPVLSGVSATRIKSRKWGYAGLWHHQGSGLDLATYRLYDAANKRWISRDPLGEGVDYNLYRYCGNNPVSNIDPEGLEPTGPPWDIPKDWNWHRGAQGESEYDDFKRLPTRYIPSPVRKPKQKKCPDTFAEQSPGGGVGYSDWNFGINKPDIHKTRIEDLKKPVPFPKTYGIHGRVQRILTVLLDLDSGNAQRDREAQDAWNRLSPQEQARRREEERGLRDMMNQNQP